MTRTLLLSFAGFFSVIGVTVMIWLLCDAAITLREARRRHTAGNRWVIAQANVCTQFTLFWVLAAHLVISIAAVSQPDAERDSLVGVTIRILWILIWATLLIYALYARRYRRRLLAPPPSGESSAEREERVGE